MTIPLAVLILSLIAWRVNIPVKTGLHAGLFIGSATAVCAVVMEKIIHEFDVFSLFIVQVTFIVMITCILIMIRFFRNPDRAIPMNKRVIVSPADGVVRYIKNLRGQEILFSEKKGQRFSIQDMLKLTWQGQGGILIGIEMSILDVHVNRSPVEGTVEQQIYSKGRFKSLRKINALFENERMTTIIRTDHMRIAVVQIASRLVRRIVSYVKEGDRVERGERLGMIKFGSQVDVLIPLDVSARLCVETGEKVKAGSSILCTYENGTKEVIQ
jgi:phosphatidylserine decarboxylase